VLASTIGQLGHPFYEAFAWILAEAYHLVPNYAIAIAILTLIVMIVCYPITLRGTRGMMKMQVLAPEMKKLQAKYKVTPGLTVGERQEIKQRQQEEMMALYKENNVSPAGGCLPMLLQMPIFLILYGTIRGLVHTTKVKGVVHYVPLYINHASRLYKDVIAAHGHLNAFGVNLADSVRTSGISAAAKIPFVAMILAAVALQYIQMKQLSGRNPQAAAANPQMQQMQKIFPILFAVIYISIPAGVNVYFIVSSLFRIGQQEFIYRRDPHIQEAMSKLRARSGSAKSDDQKFTAQIERPKGVLGRLAQFSGQMTPATEGGVPPGGVSPRPSAAGRNGSGANRSKNGAKGKSAPAPRSHPRAQGKRPRRPR
jgi:YidC/Oxa1 family membrane protein insertase